jgi:hypothetical protein
VGVETATIVSHLEQQRPVLLPEPDADLRVGARVLSRVLDRLQTAEIDRCLDLRRVSPCAVELDAAGHRQARQRRFQRVPEPPIDEQRRVDAVRQVADLLDGRVNLGGELLEDLPRALGIGGGELVCDL